MVLADEIIPKPPSRHSSGCQIMGPPIPEHAGLRVAIHDLFSAINAKLVLRLNKLAKRISCPHTDVEDINIQGASYTHERCKSCDRVKKIN